MNVRLPPLDLFWSQAWNAFGPYLVPTLIAAALLVLLLLLGRKDGADGHAPPSAGSRTEGIARRARPAEVIPHAAAPAASRAPLVATPRPAPAAPPAPAPALLVVDDSAVVRAKLRKLLEGAGYRVVLAHDGQQALAALPGEFFSLLITDLEMPNMGGLELIASVQGSLETEDLPIIAITGHDELQAHVRDCQGLYGLFRKPWNDRELLRRVEALVALRARPAQPRAVPEPALH
ncbi:response regulator [Aquincola sp. J276]|uniref:response regulator n=1 Tax=Aquincola sp. J276 TaxID=2898432 RepID=UPI002151518E|nr:response regulator [Aquincola sp. J276]MCR5867030.1 response regulator [Aquincola sp. J276]